MDTELGCIGMPTLDDVGQGGFGVDVREEPRDLDPAPPVRMPSL